MDNVLVAVPDTIPDVDEDAAIDHARGFLNALGVRCDSPGTTDTPRRMAEAYLALLSSAEFDMTTFPNAEGYDELVIVKDIPVQSVCEHHVLPFTGVAHVGYLPGDRILGLSKFARVVEMFARRPQVQERLTVQIADWLVDSLAPRWGRRGDRGRAPVHDLARCPGRRHEHVHVGAARAPAGAPADPGGVPGRYRTMRGLFHHGE